MQHIELGKRDAPSPHLLHAGLVFVTPGIGEAKPVGAMSERFQHSLGLARDAGTPIHKGAEYVEEQRLDGGRRTFGHVMVRGQDGSCNGRADGNQMDMKGARHIIAASLR